jgi:hypothetical protein
MSDDTEQGNFEPWNPYEEELYCLIVVSDEVGEKVLGKELAKGRAYLRGFVMTHRTTGKTRAIFRFHQVGGKNWYLFEGKTVEEFRDGLVYTFTKTLAMMPTELDDPNPVKVFYPPQGGTGDDQIAYLLDNDLVEITAIEHVPKPQ